MANSNKKKKQEQRKRQEITGLILMAVAVIVFLSIISHNIHDYPGDPGSYMNYLNKLGAVLSYYILNFSIGYPVLIFVVLIFLFGFLKLIGKDTIPLKKQSVYLFALMLLLSFILGLVEEFSEGGALQHQRFCGVFGLELARLSNIGIGGTGSVIVVLTLSLILFILWLNLSVAMILEKTGSASKTLFEAVREKINKMNERREKRKRFETMKRKLREEQEPEPPEPVVRKEPEEDEAEEVIDIDSYDPEDEEYEVGEEGKPEEEVREYKLPTLNLLAGPEFQVEQMSQDELLENARKLEHKLADFGVEAKVVKVTPGPVLTQYELTPATGVKINRIVSLADDITLAMKAKSIRIVAPLPGKGTVGVEIPNRVRKTVYLKSLLSSRTYQESKSILTLAMGKTISGDLYFDDLKSMPHLLIAGTTGSGKSVGIHGIIASILYKAKPDDVRFVFIDPKKIELSVYRHLKHHHLMVADGLNEDIITKAGNAVEILNAVVQELELRFDYIGRTGCRNLDEYNEKMADGWEVPEGESPLPKKMPYLVVVIDELADLMMVSAKEVEEPIARIAQMGRAAGIHLIVATQRPDKDVITGIIKANFPARMAFYVREKINSRIILDMNGAETLLEKGDMLYVPKGGKPVRLQGPFISTQETENIAKYIKSQPKFKQPQLAIEPITSDDSTSINGGFERDSLFNEAMKLVIMHQQASASMLQRRLRVGYARAARLIDELEEARIIGPADGSKPREVLLDDIPFEDPYDEEDD